MINHKVNPCRRVGIILNLFIAFNLIFVVTGCVTVTAPPPSSLELHTLWATGSEANSLHTLIDRYHTEHPDVSVNVVTYSPSSARDIVTTEKASGNLSGLYQWPMGRDLINFWTGSEDSESLESAYSSYSQTGLDSALPQGMLSILRYNFHPSSIPVNVHRTNVLWYNKSIIESNGIDPTTLETFEGWEAAAQTLKRSGVTPLALYDNSRQSVLELFEVILAGTLGADGYRGLWSGTTSWTAPEVGISLQRLQMMLQYTNRAQTLETGPQQVLDGKAAMTIADDQVYSQFAGSMEGGKIIMAGSFNNVDGQARDNIVRLDRYGHLDKAFDPAGANGNIYALVVQAPGKIVVGGLFTKLGGQDRNYIGRLNADGTLDSAFNPGANGSVLSLAVQADGKILVGGDFTALGGESRHHIGRLNADGSLDKNFNPIALDDTSTITTGEVYTLAVQEDGKILVGGQFTKLNGQARRNIGRLYANGTLDTDFNPGVEGFLVDTIAVDAGGNILVGGSFNNVDGQARDNIVRLDKYGHLDPGFDPAGADRMVYTLVVQADGKILVGGFFNKLGGQDRKYIGRLNANGILDSAFNPGANNIVKAMAEDTDGNILVAGYFTQLGGQDRKDIGRFDNLDNNDSHLDSTFDPGAEGNGVMSLAVQTPEFANIGWTASPGTRGIYMAFSDPFVLSRGSDTPAMHTFLGFLSSKNGQQEFNDLAGSICARTDCDYRKYDWYLQSSAADWTFGRIVRSLSHHAATDEACLNSFFDIMDRGPNISSAQAVSELNCKIQPSVVHVIWFSTGWCYWCGMVRTQVLPPLKQKYGDRLQIDEIMIQDSHGDDIQPGGDIYDRAVQQYNIPTDMQGGFPLMIAGGQLLFAENVIESRLPNLIEQGLDEGGWDWPSIYIATPTPPPEFYFATPTPPPGYYIVTPPYTIQR